MLSALRYPSGTIAPVAPLRCLIVDSDPDAAASLAACVRQEPALSLAANCASPAQALAYLRTHPVDVLFLPIELPLLAGLRLLRPVSQGPAVVLTSGYPDYNLHSYGTYGVVDYLPKPFCPARFRQVAGRLLTQCPAATPALTAGMFAQPHTDGLYLWVAKQLVQLRLSEVLYVEDLGSHTRIKTLHQELLTEETFTALAGQLPEPQFLRVNATCTVALRHATATAGNALVVAGRRMLLDAAMQDEVLARVFQISL